MKWHISRENHCDAFEALCVIVDEKSLENMEIFLSSDLNYQYNMVLTEIGGQEYSGITPHATQRLEEKLRQWYKGKIKIEKGKTKRGNVIFSSAMSYTEAFRKEHSMENKTTSNIRDMAFFLRDAIFQAEEEKLPEKPKLKDIFNGGVKTPDVLTQFLTHLVCSPDVRRGKSEIKQKRVNIIYAATADLKVPKKHIQLGLVTKSLTGSKKLLNVLNRYGHSISYTATEEIETELTYKGTKENVLIPNDMKACENTSVGLAFDNYDHSAEMFSGKNTLHDTVGIAYQLRNDAEDGNEDEDENPDKTVIQKGKQRRRYEAINLDLEPY